LKEKIIYPLFDMIRCTIIDLNDNSKVKFQGRSFKEIQKTQELYLKQKYDINLKIRYK